MSISLELSNLGPLRSAELDVADLTLLIGENNTGKTFFATVLHRVLGAVPSTPSRHREQLNEVPDQVRKWVREVLDGHSFDTAVVGAGRFSPNTTTLSWAEEFTTDILEGYGRAVRDYISYAFGVEPSRLRRRTRSRYASDCYLRIRSSHPEWRVDVRFDSDAVNITTPDPESWIISVLDSNEIRKSTQDNRHLRSSLSSDSRFFYGYGHYSFVRRAYSILFDSWPHSAIHFPADRTGIMQSHNLLAAAAARQSVRAGIRPIEIETLPGTSADFLALVLEILEGMAHSSGEPTRFDAPIRKFERDLRASIEVDNRVDGMEAIVAVTSEGRFPMGRASSMLSELAPLLLVLKSPYQYVDHLTIDEPEAHLHPEMQIRVASFLATLVNAGIRIVLTTHSDFFVAQFNNMMRLNELYGSSRRSRSYDLPRLDRAKVRSLRFSRENSWCVARKSQPDRVDGIDESTFTEPMRSQYNDTARLINELLEADSDSSQCLPT